MSEGTKDITIIIGSNTKQYSYISGVYMCESMCNGSVHVCDGNANVFIALHWINILRGAEEETMLDKRIGK